MAKQSLPMPGTITLTKMAANLVNQEIARIIGPAGALLCLKISAHLQLIHPLYRQYFDLVDKGEIQLETMRKYFSDEAWAKIGNPQKRALEKYIKQEVERTRQQIAAHMFQLDDNEREMRTLSPAGKEALAVVLRELTGEGDMKALPTCPSAPLTLPLPGTLAAAKLVVAPESVEEVTGG